MQGLRKLLLATTGLMIGLGPIGIGVAAAQDRVTVMLRSGEKLSGRFDGVANDRFYLDISDSDERHIPMGDIAVIDLTQGANNLPDARSQLVVTMFAPPGTPILTVVGPDELAERRHLRFTGTN